MLILVIFVLIYVVDYMLTITLICGFT